MRKLILILILLIATVGNARSLTSVSQVEGSALHTIQSAWLIVDSELSDGGEPNALTVTERTKLLVDAAIAAGLASDGEIEVFSIPPKWNAIRFRAIGITDGATLTHQIYLGTLGGGLDCELSHAGQLAWVIGPQQSIYDQIAFTLGGAGDANSADGVYIPQPGDIVDGNESGETAIIVSIVETASTWSAGTAAGTVLYRSATGIFTSGETVSIKRGNIVLTDNAYKHVASDLIDFELADTLTITAKAWGSSWSSTSPADNDTNAEAELDIKGADYLVIVTTVASVDGKLLIKGY